MIDNVDRMFIQTILIQKTICYYITYLSKKLHAASIFLNNSLLKINTRIKYFCNYLDEYLDFKSHCNYLISNLNSQLC